MYIHLNILLNLTANGRLVLIRKLNSKENRATKGAQSVPIEIPIYNLLENDGTDISEGIVYS